MPLKATIVCYDAQLMAQLISRNFNYKLQIIIANAIPSSLLAWPRNRRSRLCGMRRKMQREFYPRKKSFTAATQSKHWNKFGKKRRLPCTRGIWVSRRANLAPWANKRPPQSQFFTHPIFLWFFNSELRISTWKILLCNSICISQRECITRLLEWIRWDFCRMTLLISLSHVKSTIAKNTEQYFYAEERSAFSLSMRYNCLLVYSEEEVQISDSLEIRFDLRLIYFDVRFERYEWWWIYQFNRST